MKTPHHNPELLQAAIKLASTYPVIPVTFFLGFNFQPFITVPGFITEGTAHMVADVLRQSMCWRALLYVRGNERSQRVVLIDVSGGRVYSFRVADGDITWLQSRSKDDFAVKELRL